MIIFHGHNVKLQKENNKMKVILEKEDRQIYDQSYIMLLRKENGMEFGISMIYDGQKNIIDLKF